MDPLDAASDRALAYQGTVTPTMATRDLSAAEIRQICEHMVGTNMTTSDALRALHFDILSLCIDDLDRIAALITTCTRCGNWAHRRNLVQTICPVCWEELEEQRATR